MPDDTLRDVPYRRDIPLERFIQAGTGTPHAFLSGWDDEQVYLNVACACGRTFQHGPLSEDGTLEAICGVCECIYTVLVTVEVRGGRDA
jgi:hypothetical protein